MSRCSCSREVCNYDLIILPPYGSSMFKNLCCRNSCGVSGTLCVSGCWVETLLRPLQVAIWLNLWACPQIDQKELVFFPQARPVGGNWMLYSVLREDTPLCLDRDMVILRICSWFLLQGSEAILGCGTDVDPLPLSNCFWFLILLFGETYYSRSFGS